MTTSYSSLNMDCKTEFERHVKRAYPVIYRHAYRLLRDRCDAEEVTQDAFVRAWRHFGSYDGERKFENWMLRIVTNLVIDRKRRRHHASCSLDAAISINEEGDEGHFDPPDFASDPARQVLDNSIDPRMACALGELSNTFRKVIVMADVQEYS
jgi:RNA polymerase sigma-70 factor (ECF subfamily)